MEKIKEIIKIIKSKIGDFELYEISPTEPNDDFKYVVLQDNKNSDQYDLEEILEELGIDYVVSNIKVNSRIAKELKKEIRNIISTNND